MKPGATTLPAASMTRAADASMRDAIRTIVSPLTATSPRYHGLPVPSTMRPLRISRSIGAVCARGATASSTRHAEAMRAARVSRMPRSIGRNRRARQGRGVRFLSGLRALGGSFLLVIRRSKEDRVVGGVANQQPVLDRVQRHTGSAQTIDELATRGFVGESECEVLEPDRPRRRRRRSDARPGVQADVVMVAAGRDEERTG